MKEVLYILPTLAISGALYVAPKVLEYLSTKPDEIHSRVDQLRGKIANLAEAAKSLVGERAWFVITEIYLKNAWISFLAISYLTRNNPPFRTVDQGIETICAFFVFCTTAALIKHFMRLFFPSSPYEPETGIELFTF